MEWTMHLGNGHGSPPGIWGKGVGQLVHCTDIRFTPRHLGKGIAR